MGNLTFGVINGLDTYIPKVDAGHATVGTIFNALYAITGLLAIIFIMLGAFRYAAAGGDPSSITKAKNSILYAVIGLVVTLLAFAITNLLLGSIKVDTWQHLRDSVVNTLLFAVGAVAVIMIIFGGFRYVTANGNAQSITGAKTTIIGAIIGIIVAALAFAIVNFVIATV